MVIAPGHRTIRACEGCSFLIFSSFACLGRYAPSEGDLVDEQDRHPPAAAAAAAGTGPCGARGGGKGVVMAGYSHSTLRWRSKFKFARGYKGQVDDNLES